MSDEPRTLVRLTSRLIAKLIYYWLGFTFGYLVGEQLATVADANITPLLASRALEIVIGVSAFVAGFLLVCLSEIIAQKKPAIWLVLAGFVFFLGITFGYGAVRFITF